LTAETDPTTGEASIEPGNARRLFGIGWKRLLLLLGGLVVVVLAVIQAVPYGRDHTNPPVTAAPTWDSPATERLFADACADCHSNLTDWAWYTSVAPFSWLAQKDVDDGREALNLSELGRTEIELAEIAELVRSGEMPPWQYRLIHADARLSEAEKEALIRGLNATLAGIAEAADPTRGEEGE
jgi:mono/diheme cytochrome c family protein